VPSGYCERCDLLLGLPGLHVVGVQRDDAGLRVEVESVRPEVMGCPACGTEELDDGEFEPFFAEAESQLKDVKVGLFGSYGWGGGAFMETWTQRTKDAGAVMVADGVTCESEPDDDALAACTALGETMAKAVG